jgi:hypothetical protein
VSNLEAFLEDNREDAMRRIFPADKPMTPRREAASLRLARMQARKYNPIVDTETRLRIKVALYAYTYEFESVPLVSDGEFDDLCSKINLEVSTRRPDLDKWFRDNFEPHTGQWIHKHPELEKLKHIYEEYYKHDKKTRSNRKKVKSSARNS